MPGCSFHFGSRDHTKSCSRWQYSCIWNKFCVDTAFDTDRIQIIRACVRTSVRAGTRLHACMQHTWKCSVSMLLCEAPLTQKGRCGRRHRLKSSLPVCVYVRVGVCVFVSVVGCVRACACVRVCVRAGVQRCMHSWINTCRQTDMHVHACMHAHSNPHVHTPACIHTNRSRGSICVHILAYMHDYTHTHTPTHARTHVHIWASKKSALPCCRVTTSSRVPWMMSEGHLTLCTFLMLQKMSPTVCFRS